MADTGTSAVDATPVVDDKTRANQPCDAPCQTLDSQGLQDEFRCRESAHMSATIGMFKELSKMRRLMPDWRPRGLVEKQSAQSYCYVMDPVVNLEIKELRMLLASRDAEMLKLRDELHAANFTAESVTGRRLINKCKALQEENADLGRLLADSQLLPLQAGQRALEQQATFLLNEMKELQELNGDLDEENERLTTQVFNLTSRAKVLQRERDTARSELEAVKTDLSSKEAKSQAASAVSDSKVSRREVKKESARRADRGDSRGRTDRGESTSRRDVSRRHRDGARSSSRGRDRSPPRSSSSHPFKRPRTRSSDDHRR